MPWLWYVGPVAVLILWFLTGLRGRHEARRDRELARFRALMTPTREEQLGTYRKTRKSRRASAEAAGPRLVRSLPGSLQSMLEETGGGVPVARYELVPKRAYVAVMGPSFKNGSEYQAVLLKLASAAPPIAICPLPIIDGARAPNNGVQFKKDPEFMELFLVEGPDAKAIGKWLPRSLRDALREFPDAWLYVQDRAAALVAYGPVDADRMEALVAAANAIFALHGGEGAPSLLPDEPERASAGDEEEDEEDDEDEEDADEEEDEEDDEDEGDDEEDDGGEAAEPAEKARSKSTSASGAPRKA